MTNDYKLIDLYLEEFNDAIQRAEVRFNEDTEAKKRDASRINNLPTNGPPLDRALRIAVIKFSQKTPY